MLHRSCQIMCHRITYHETCFISPRVVKRNKICQDMWQNTTVDSSLNIPAESSEKSEVRDNIQYFIGPIQFTDGDMLLT